MNNTSCADVEAPSWLSISTATISAILLIFTVSGNFLVCLAVYKDPHKRLRTPFMFILVNLAMTDLVVGCITMPISVSTHSMEALGTKKKEHAIVMRMSYFVSCTASILNLTAFCVDRYIAIHSPMKYRRLLTSKVCLAIFVTIWILAIGITSLYMVAGFMNFLLIFAQISFVLAVIITVVTYRLLRKLRHYSVRRRTMSNKSSASSRKSDKRITTLFMIMLLMFFICYTPAITSMYILWFCPRCNCNLRHILRDFQFLFMVSNSTVNPFVCTIRLRPFRAALKTIFGLGRKEEDDKIGFSTVGFHNKHEVKNASIVKHDETIPFLSDVREEADGSNLKINTDIETSN